MKNTFFSVVSVLSLVLSSSTWAGDAIPLCLGRGGQALSVNNNQILAWKNSEPNQFQARGHVTGPVTRVFDDHSGHHHFEISIGKGSNDTLEVIYNEDFGSMPQVQIGDQTEACGDFIVSTAQSGPYPPSPSGAIIHWVHISPDLSRHESGYVALNGTVYGQDMTNANPDPRHNNQDQNQNQNQNQQGNGGNGRPYRGGGQSNSGSHHHRH